MSLDRPSGGSRLQPSVDTLIFWGLFAGYLAWLLATTGDLGYSRDEGFYFHAARQYGRWFELLGTDPIHAMEPDVVDRYWRENHEHPALMKSLFWASRHGLWGSVLSERGTAFRFPAMLLSALCVATVFGWGRRALGRVEGVVAALFFAGMPRVFYHAHLACFDMPIAALWLWCAYAYQRSAQTRGVRWAVIAALLYGLALNTKHNAWLLPFALLLHALLRKGRHLLPELRRGRLRLPAALPAMLVGGPIVLFATWPWLWHETGKRLLGYVRFHVQHVYYNMEFLGQTYFEPPMPRGYAWLMTVATVPLVTLTCFALGLMALVVNLRARSQTLATAGAELGATRAQGGPGLWLVCVLLAYAPWLSSTTPIFGGTKHWLPAYPFLALLAAYGFGCVRRALSASLFVGGAQERRWREPGLAWLLAGLLCIGPLVMTGHSHPWALSAYTPIVGGAPGAATLGLNRTFWGYSTGAVTSYLNAATREGDRVYVHDTALESFRMLRRDGRLARGLRARMQVAGSQFALYHHEQHMSRVEHMIWVDYQTTTPRHVADFDGVPVIWVYERPSVAPRDVDVGTDHPPM